MPFCSKCGFEVDIDDNFCAKCGFTLKDVEEDEREVEDSNEEEEPTIEEQDKGEEHFVDWVKKDDDKNKSFWHISKQSLKHVFFDGETKISKNRKIVNVVLGILIIIIALWIITPYLNNIKISIGENGQVIENGQCKYRLDALGVIFSDVKLFSDELKMEVLITNDKDKDVVLESVVKTYEFRFDNAGDTEIEVIEKVIPHGETINLTFSVKEEPYILGFDFSNCEKKKVSKWKIITSE